MTNVPKIDPVTEGQRPLWSVMIPAYEGAEYLAKTIRSVLVQDLGPEMMQIEVVDDYSLKQDLRGVVEKVGRGRVSYFRQPKNVGATENFNTCVQRSRGMWVHILHGDDMVMPGFYEKLHTVTEQPAVSAAFCRFVFMDEHDHWTSISGLESTRADILPEWLDKIAVNCRIQTPSIVVRRQAYEEVGGYDSRLFHCADWDMWKRIAARYPVWYEPSVLACYRIHTKSDTTSLMRSGRNIQDTRRSIALAKDYLPEASREKLTSQALRHYAHYALGLAWGMLQKRDFAGTLAQSREALKTSCSPNILAALIRMMGRGGVAYVRGSVRRLGGRGVQSPQAELRTGNAK